MRKYIAAIALAMGVTFMVATPAEAVQTTQTLCVKPKDGVNVSVCHRAYLSHGATWPRTTWRLDKSQIWIKGDVATLETTRSLVITQWALHGKNSATLWGPKSYNLSQANRSHTLRVDKKFSTTYGVLRFKYQMRDNGGSDAYGIVYDRLQ